MHYVTLILYIACHTVFVVSGKFYNDYSFTKKIHNLNFSFEKVIQETRALLDK